MRDPRRHARRQETGHKSRREIAKTDPGEWPAAWASDPHLMQRCAEPRKWRFFDQRVKRRLDQDARIAQPFVPLGDIVGRAVMKF
jgi:hypothetical protein